MFYSYNLFIHVHSECFIQLYPVIKLLHRVMTYSRQSPGYVTVLKRGHKLQDTLKGLNIKHTYFT